MNTSPAQTLQRTPLHELHQELGARMVPFAGYSMPVQYPSGLMKEHLHCRARAGLFDVSHMGQLRLSGEAAARALERLAPVDIVDLGEMRQRYALFTNESGGVLDDLMVTNAGDHLFVVINAACKEQDIAHMRAHIGADCHIEVLDEHALLALQGPAAAKVLAQLAPETEQLVFMTAAHVVLQGVRCFVTRSGYSGEDGFEISVLADRADALARALLAHDDVQAIGLGARDSLRLEAGLCLYGHDMDSSTTPVEASLGWALSKSRRAEGSRAGGYPGAQTIHAQQASGVDRRRVGIRPAGRAPVREGTQLTDADGRAVGHVTSGGFGPTVGGPVAMGYVATPLATPGAEVFATVRGKALPVTVAKLPFVKQNYYRG